MDIKLTYNNDILTIQVPDTWKVDSFAPKTDDNVLSYDHFVRTFTDANTDRYLSESSQLIVVNDAHRSTPTPKLLTWFKTHKPKVFENAHFIVACGTHEPPDRAQFGKIFGDLYKEVKGRISFHNCHDYETMTRLGKDSFGEHLWIDKKLFEYDKVFVINSVEPHYFAGFTGGRKSLIPGLADFKTIERNHNLANSLECAPMKIAGNPMAEHLESLMGLIDTSNIFTLQVVYDSQKEVKQLCFGDIKNAFSEAVKFAKEMYTCISDNFYDVALLEILPPLDKSIYQAQKALENCQKIVKDDGAAIIMSACADGIGSRHFYDLADSWDKDTNQAKDGRIHFGSHKLSRVNAIGKRIHACLHSIQPDEPVAKVFYEPVRDLDSYLIALGNNKDEVNLAVIHDAAHTVMEIYDNEVN